MKFKDLNIYFFTINIYIFIIAWIIMMVTLIIKLRNINNVDDLGFTVFFIPVVVLGLQIISVSLMDKFMLDDDGE